MTISTCRCFVVFFVFVHTVSILPLCIINYMSKAKPYIIFLRGVMPFGKNKVPMALLRQALIDAGLDTTQVTLNIKVSCAHKANPSLYEK